MHKLHPKEIRASSGVRWNMKDDGGCRADELTEYIDRVCAYWDGNNPDFVPIPISEEVDLEMPRDSFY